MLDDTLSDLPLLSDFTLSALWKLAACHQICAGADAAADSCDSNPQCATFDMEGDYCGYLKGAGGVQQYTEGFTNYCKVGGPAKCSGESLDSQA